MAYKKKATPGTNQFNKLFTELPEKRNKIKAQIEFTHDLLESQKRINYQSEFDRLQGAKELPGLDANKVKNARITKESETTIERGTISSYLFYYVLIENIIL